MQRSRTTQVVVLGGLGLCLVAAIGWLDASTGPDFGFSLFYLVPIVLAGWLLGPRAALVPTRDAPAIAAQG